jgi:hypothetical protein
MALFGSKRDLRADIQAARDALATRGTMGIGKALENLEGKLLDGERVIGMAVYRDEVIALAALTDQRVLLVKDSISKRGATDVWLRQIQAVSFERNRGQMVREGRLVIVAGGLASIVVDHVFAEDGERLRAQISQQIAAVSAPAASAPIPSAAPPPPPSVPAGWYPDQAAEVQRYWDGARWTEHTAPLG